MWPSRIVTRAPPMSSPRNFPPLAGTRTVIFVSRDAVVFSMFGLDPDLGRTAQTRILDRVVGGNLRHHLRFRVKTDDIAAPNPPDRLEGLSGPLSRMRIHVRSTLPE